MALDCLRSYQRTHCKNREQAKEAWQTVFSDVSRLEDFKAVDVDKEAVINSCRSWNQGNQTVFVKQQMKAMVTVTDKEGYAVIFRSQLVY